MLTLKRCVSLTLAVLTAISLLASCASTGSTPPASGSTPAPGPQTEKPAEPSTVYTMKVAGSGIDNHTDYMLNLFEELVEERSNGQIQDRKSVV